MKPDIETRGRPRNNDFADFCELLASDFDREAMDKAVRGDKFLVYGILQNGKKAEYKNFRNAASLSALKKDLARRGFETSVYFQDGKTYLKVRKV